MEHLKTSVIIPTLNRKSDLEKTLASISECDILPFEIIIIDQSDNNETKKLCNNFYELNIRYFYTDIKSSALARNIWIDNLDKETDLVLFLDDDVLLEKNFFEELEKFFLDNKNAKWWVANISNIARQITFLKKVWLFLLSWKWQQTDFYVTTWWFNAMPFINPNNVKNIEWAPWCGMFFRKCVFDEWFRFEKNFMKYSLMEDCFLSYWIQEKYPNSLFLIPSVKMIHCESPASRIANKQRIYQNIIHRYYFVEKFRKNFIAYLWTMFIFSIFDFIQYRTFKVFYWYIKWIRYIRINRKNIWRTDFNFNKFIFW